MPTIPVPTRQKTEAAVAPAASAASIRAADAAVLVAMLGLTFLLGVFPLKDVDFWWHLRTGDLIRQSGEVPRVDPYTYTVPEHTWIDLHWGFQVLLSLGFDRGGVVLLNLAKCAITTLAVGLLVTARRREWPLWTMSLSWLPALLLLGGRMYIRPETLTLLYLAAYLAVLIRWDRVPWLGYALPVVQLLWVNSQGLFVFGPFLLALALLDAAIRPGAFDAHRRGWWRMALSVTALVGLACLFNPYGLRGALFPITDLLFGTLNDPVFDNIAELSSIAKLIDDTAGYPHLMLIIHLSVAGLGALSFLLPTLWHGFVRLSKGSPSPPEAEPSARRAKGKAKGSRKTSGPKAGAGRGSVVPGWSPSLFRLLLYLTFTFLSLQATRNSHQFAAVVGTVTAWNFGEWASAIRARRERLGTARPHRLWPRLATLGATSTLIAVVGSGAFYAMAEEDRTIGLGEEPAWFPHRAVEFAGTQGLPPRFLGVHIGHNALFIHEYGPGRKVFADPRLEVMGADQYREYSDLSRAIGRDDAGAPWRSMLEAAGRPVVLADHLHSSAIGATLLADPSWPCLWFDEVAAVFAHEADAEAAGLPAVDFLGRHFGTQEDLGAPRNAIEWAASARGISTYVLVFLEQRQRFDLARTMIPLGLDRAREARRQDPGAADPWAFAAALELGRIDDIGSPVRHRRYLRPFDPTSDLHAARVATFAGRALRVDADQQIAMSALLGLFLQREMHEAVLPILQRATARRPRSPSQATGRARLLPQLDRIRSELGPEPRIDVRNGDRIRRSVDALLASGRVESAAELLERQYPPPERDWTTADRIATFRMHLGQPDLARRAWQSVAEPPDPALREARVAASYYAEDDLDAALESYRDALALGPDSFEARYGLALTAFDLGHADLALDAAQGAADIAPDADHRADAEAIARLSRPYAVGD